VTDLNATLEYPNQVWSWAVVEFPVDYSELEGRCARLGKSLVNLDDVYGYLVLPDNSTSEFSTTELSVNGDAGIYGKSLLLRDLESNRRICATITMVDKTQEKIAVARFNSPVAGNVYFRWFSTKDNHNDMLITTDLYQVAKQRKQQQDSLVDRAFVEDLRHGHLGRGQGPQRLQHPPSWSSTPTTPAKAKLWVTSTPDSARSRSRRTAPKTDTKLCTGTNN
jgi:hypothetical protein